MLPRRTFVIVGMSFLIFGSIFLLAGAEGITGNVVMENIDKDYTLVSAGILIAMGLAVLWARKEVK